MPQPHKAHGHDHEHPHAEIGQSGRPGYYDIMETAVRELLIERGVIRRDEIRRQIEVLDSRTPALGATVVARAWVDPAFKARLLADGRAACDAMVRFLVLPMQTEGTEDYTEEQLAGLVTRDAMIGVVPATVDAGRTTR